MLYSLNAGGKRLRPILSIAVWELLIQNENLNMEIKFDYNKILPLACALELIHTYSLIHDDLPAIDNDDYRRGKPTNHKVFGEAMAILAGDALLNESFLFLCKLNKYYDANKIISVIDFISKASGSNGMLGGQALDIINVNYKDTDANYLYNVNNAKTGALIKASCVCPALILGVNTNAFSIYGEAIGYAFQLIDDVLGVSSSKEVLGKTPNLDTKNKKTTYIDIFGLDKTKDLAFKEIEKAKNALNTYNNYKEILLYIADYVVNRLN